MAPFSRCNPLPGNTRLLVPPACGKNPPSSRAATQNKRVSKFGLPSPKTRFFFANTPRGHSAKIRCSPSGPSFKYPGFRIQPRMSRNLSRAPPGQKIVTPLWKISVLFPGQTQPFPKANDLSLPEQSRSGMGETSLNPIGETNNF